ncbi:hypothetical protein GCM10011320_57540 [Neoroseomonas lacus]|uniref:AsmA domain-containing protein n=2 Tax=Neoroseomonas lacus TaxID=287609 RepID=A0A917L2Y3_9PROT|nr:hypothetical protein GCM10011320_57540 [Neoroseomonas lacus]
MGLSALALVLSFSWGTFIPVAERMASNAIGRAVTIGGLHVRLGRVSLVTFRDVTVANPEGFDAEPPFARIASVELRLDTWPTLRDRTPTIPSVEIQGLDVLAVTQPDGSTNSILSLPDPTGEPGARLRIGELILREGRARILHAPLRADFTIQMETRAVAAGPHHIFATARGTYAGAPLTGEMAGGTILAVGDAGQGWPVQLELENGTTRATLNGTITDPLTLAGADLRLVLTGPDMRFLTPLTGVPIPSTPAFRVAGKLSYADRRFRFTEMEGLVGRSDLRGTVTIAPSRTRPDVTMDLQSRQVDLADLAGFIGGNPGRGRPIRDDTPRTGRVLPNAPVNLPLFRAADVHARFRAARIIGADSPFGTLDVTLELIGGVLTLKPLRGGIGAGAVVLTATLTPREDGQLHAAADFELQGLNIAHIMSSLGGEGGGALNGRARLEGIGRSTAQLLARGTGGLSLRTAGGNLSAFSVDLAGLRLGNAILSGLGLPSRTNLECFVADFALAGGVLNARTLLLDTSDAVLIGTGRIHLDEERLDLRLNSQAKNFTIASIPAELAVRGRLSNPSVQLVASESAGIFSFLPIIELGIGDDPRCRASLERMGRTPANRQPARARQ